MSVVSYSNLMKHLSWSASTKLVAKNAGVDSNPDPHTANVSSTNTKGDGAPPSKQPKLDFSAPQKHVTKLNILIARYVVENMLP